MFINITNEEFQEHRYMFTKYSLFHFLFGVIWYNYFDGKYFWWMNFLHMLFEIVENMEWFIELIRPIWPRYKGDSVPNILGDIISGIVGFYFAAYSNGN